MKKKEPKDEYRLAFEIHDKKANIYVYEPIITEEEYERRMKEIKDTFHDFWVDYYRQQTLKEKQNSLLCSTSNK